MNSNAIGKLVVLVGGLFLALFIILSVLTGANAIGDLYLYLGVGSVVLGMLAPRPGFYVLLMMTCYLDFFKRLIVVAGNVSFMHLYYILGAAPLLLLGICTGLGLQFVLGRLQLPKGIAGTDRGRDRILCSKRIRHGLRRRGRGTDAGRSS